MSQCWSSGSLIALLITVPAFAAGLPDSGQDLCDNGSNVLASCNSTNSGDAATYPRQDGRFGRDPIAMVDHSMDPLGESVLRRPDILGSLPGGEPTARLLPVRRLLHHMKLNASFVVDEIVPLKGPRFRGTSRIGRGNRPSLLVGLGPRRKHTELEGGERILRWCGKYSCGCVRGEAQRCGAERSETKCSLEAHSGMRYMWSSGEGKLHFPLAGF